MGTPRKGCEQPRIFTPPLRELTPQTSHGFSVIAFAEHTLGIALLPWQKWLFIHALELRPDGLYRFRTVITLIARQNGKALDADTPVLTTAGWSTMGRLRVGDEVFHPDGHPTRVVGAYEVMTGRRCYEVTTTDGRTLVADGEHLWTVSDRRCCRRTGRRGQRPHRTYGWEMLTTEQLLARGLKRSAREFAFRLPRQHAIVSKPVDLPIDPYLLGVWLGGGTATRPEIAVGDGDVGEMTALLEQAGAQVVSSVRERTAWKVRIRTGPRRDGFQARCQRLGVWGDKHVPVEYLTAGTEQRLALLQGLMDSDGSIRAGTARSSAQAEFCSTNERLAAGVLYLLRSLGWRATIRESVALLGGREVGRRWRVYFTPERGEPVPFRLRRKAARVQAPRARGGERHAVSIRSIREVASRPVRCIKVDRPDGLFLAGADLIPTHNTLCMLILALWHIYARGSRTVIGTAQDLANAEKAWGEAVELAESVPELKAGIRHVSKVNGKKSLILAAGEQYRVAAASRRGARGFSGDLVLLDELREHQSWDAWGASTKTTLARPHAQVWGFSNAGDSLSVVLRYLRALAHQALGWPDGDADAAALGLAGDDHDTDELDDGEDESLGLFEWSAPPTADRRDRDAWAQANPSMGWGTITERAIAAALRTDPPAVFSVEVLCRWIESADTGPFDATAWAATLDAGSAIASGTRHVVGVDVSWNRSRAYIALAGHRADGVAHVEITADRAGTDWVTGWLTERTDRIDAVVLQANGAPVSSLLAELVAAGLPVIAWAGPDLGRATGQTYDLIERRAVRHLPHPGLDTAATTAAVKPAGDAWVIDRRRSPHDAAPLIAVIAALWALGVPDDPLPEIHCWPDELWEDTE